LQLRIRVVPNAEQEIREAEAWWHANRPAARALIHKELARAFQLITTQPGIGARARDTAIRVVRRLGWDQDKLTKTNRLIRIRPV
jgi:plasmid stabilization system protein ParE